MKLDRSRGKRLIIPPALGRSKSYSSPLAILPKEIKLQCLMYSMLGGFQNCPDDLVNISYSSQESNHQTAAQLLHQPPYEPQYRRLATTPATVRTSKPQPSHYTSHRTKLHTVAQPLHQTSTNLQTAAQPLHQTPYESPDGRLAATPDSVRTSRPYPSYYTTHRTNLQTVAQPLHQLQYEHAYRVIASTPTTLRYSASCCKRTVSAKRPLPKLCFSPSSDVPVMTFGRLVMVLVYSWHLAPVFRYRILCKFHI